MKPKLTPDDLIAFFREKTGEELCRARPLSSIVANIDPLEPSTSLQNRFGRFRLGVFQDAQSLEYARPPGSPSVEGIFWEEQFTLKELAPSYWSARKFYGNIQLIWWSDRRAVDEGWKSLDRILTDLLAQKTAKP